MTNEYKLRAELSNSKIYQSNSNSHEYLRTGKYLKSKTVVFEDNSEIEDLLHKYEDSKIDGSKFTLANRISVLF